MAVVDVGAFWWAFILGLKPGPGVCVRSCIPWGDFFFFFPFSGMNAFALFPYWFWILKGAWYLLRMIKGPEERMMILIIVISRREY